MKKRYGNIIETIRSRYGNKEFIALHEPVFLGNEKKYLNECIDSTFVSSIGKFVDLFEKRVAEYTGSRFAVATVNGTAALHIALKVAGAEEGCEVITQPLTFVATCNAISYCGAHPVFVDVERETLGMNPERLEAFLQKHVKVDNGVCINKTTGRRIAAVVPMHTFGHPCRIDEIVQICDRYGIALVEDAAESLGSFYKGRHMGRFALVSAFSFNGNKTITTGGGGMIVTDDEAVAARARHITTTAKVPHPYDYIHDEIGYNYRLPNLNAALGCAQMEQLDCILADKRETAKLYAAQFREDRRVTFVREPEHAHSNYWLNALLCENRQERDTFLQECTAEGIMARPVWRLMHRLEIYKEAQRADLSDAEWLEERLVNIPSGYRGGKDG